MIPSASIFLYHINYKICFNLGRINELTPPLREGSILGRRRRDITSCETSSKFKRFFVRSASWLKRSTWAWRSLLTSFNDMGDIKSNANGSRLCVQNFAGSSRTLISRKTYSKTTSKSSIRYSSMFTARRRDPFEQRVFSINKGARVFEYSKDKNVLITGGNINI